MLTTFLGACGNQSDKQPSNANQDSSLRFLPVTSFIQSELAVIDSMPVTILQVHKEKGKVDSIWLKREAVRPLLKPFISDEIGETNLIPWFQETKFNDLTIESITFTYTPKSTLPDSIHLRQWNVYVNSETGRIRKLFIQKELNNGKILQQLTWTNGKSATINMLEVKPDGTTEFIQGDQFIWDFTSSNTP